MRLIQHQAFVDKDNEAFAAEFEPASADSGTGDGEWPGTADWEAPQNNAEKDQQVNVSTEEVQGRSQQEMQEKAGSSLLGGASTTDSGWEEVKRDESMMDQE